MQSLIRQIVQSELAEYTEQFSLQEKAISDLTRRLNNLIRVGAVSAWSENHKRIKVQCGGNETPFIKWFSACAGDVAEYRLPSIGEQVVLLNIGDGDSLATCIALIGVPSDKFPLPTSNPNEILRVYPDGTRVCYDKEKHQLDVKVAGVANVVVDEDATVNVGGNAKLTVSGTTKVTSGGDATVDAPNIKLNGGTGVVTGAHKCMVTGLPHGDCSSTVTAGV